MVAGCGLYHCDKHCSDCGLNNDHYSRLSGCHAKVLFNFNTPIPSKETTTWPRGTARTLQCETHAGVAGKFQFATEPGCLQCDADRQHAFLSAVADAPAYHDALKQEMAATGGFHAYMQKQLAELDRKKKGADALRASWP